VAAPCSQCIACSPVRKRIVAGRSTRSLDRTMYREFEALYHELSAATRAHYRRLIDGGREVCGYSLYTADDVPSIGPVANYVDAIKVHPADPLYNYYRFGPHEWPEFDDFGMFETANGLLKELYSALPLAIYRAGALKTAFDVLVALEAEGVFGPRTDSRFVVLWISDSNDSIMDEAAEVLNSAAAYRSFSTAYE
jgi:Domain of unknown function (DUF4303)